MEKINVWAVANRLTINVDKTESMIFSFRDYDTTDSPLRLGSNDICYRDECKFLGVSLDNKLTFGGHVSSVLSKVSKSGGLLYKIRNFLTPEARLNFYYSFIYPYLMYNVSIWGKTHACILDPLIIAQKRIVRCIAGAEYRAHTNPLFKEYSILKLEDIYSYVTSLYMFKNHQNIEFLNKHEFSTRERELARPSYQRLTTCQKALSFAGPTQWNLLPTNLRETLTVGRFKK